MASRPPGTTRSKKASTRTLPPVTTVTDKEQTRADANAETAENRAADGVVGESGAHDVKITESKLEQREIPSFSDSREARIAEAAYWRAERRGFAPGHELDDWLHAEREVDAQKDQNR
jgi:hypothetical protein